MFQQHLNQSRENVRSDKHKAKLFKVANTTQLKGKRESDIYTKVYNVRENLLQPNRTTFNTVTIRQHIRHDPSRH